MPDKTLYERYDAETQRSTEVLEDADTGIPYIVKSQNTRPIVESAKAIASSFDPHIKRDITHVARIPYVIWQRLQMLGITRDEKAFNAWLDSREARAFRTDNNRRL
jgi:hypothetical protein